MSNYNQEKYHVYESSPIDSWNDFVKIEDFSEFLICYLHHHIKSDLTFSTAWCRVLDKIKWAFCDCDFIDKDLRSNHIYIHFEKMEDEDARIFILFKADNNGTVYLIVDQERGYELKKIPHEYQCDWERVYHNEDSRDSAKKS